MAASWKIPAGGGLGTIAAIALAFLVEPIFPLGSIRWAGIIVACAVVWALLYRKEIADWMRKRESLLSPSVPHLTPEPTEPEPPEPSTTAKAFDLAPNSGSLAATLIGETSTAEAAATVYETWKAQENRIDPRPVYLAMSTLHYNLGNDEKGEHFAMLEGWERADSDEPY